MILLLMLITFPSTFGGRGIYRVKSADIEWLFEARSILVLNADAETYRYDYSDTILDFGSARIGIAYTPVRWFEGYTLWRAHGQGSMSLPVSESDFEGDLGDMDLGSKVILKKFQNSYLGADLALTVPIGNDLYSNNGLIVYPKVLGTFDVSDYWRLLPIRGHLNIGIPIGRTNNSDAFPVTGGLALELPSKFFTYFLEITRNHERDWNWRASPGIRFHPFYRLSLTVVVDFGLVQDYRLFGANAGLSINSSLIKARETMPTGNIAGKITEKDTHTPIKAQIHILELDETSSSDEENGVYKIIGLPQGVYTLSVEATNYASEIKVVVIEPKHTELLNFELVRSSVIYQGVVLNAQNKESINGALVMIEGKTDAQISTDFDGTYKEFLIPGEYTIKINKQHYSQFVSKTTINTDLVDTIMLKPIEIAAEAPEAIVYFDLDDANIRADQRPKLDSIAEFLKTQPRIKCELRGHTDPSGNMDYNEILSLARANSVKDYLVKVHGVEKERISTLAFSKT